MSTRDDKARRYIASLDTARTEAKWDEVPELIRKVTKHAPERTSLIHAATADHRIAKHAATAHATTPAHSDLSDLIPVLQSAGEWRKTWHGDDLQAHASLSWLHWSLGELDATLSVCSNEFLGALQKGDTTSGKSVAWNHVCIVRSAYIRSAGQNQLGQPDEALKTYASMSAWMDRNQLTLLGQPQLSYWSEQLLAQTALTATRHIDFHNVQTRWVDVALESFRHWAVFAARSNVVSPALYGNATASSPKLFMWRAYHELLSNLLQRGIEYPSDANISPRLKQSTELRRVESLYENELLRVTRFPKATESNSAVEDWVEQVIRNWTVLGGPYWTDEELGQGGRNAVGRGVLDVLYRAAAKTFHSTLILRRLFQVHKSLTDFDLAFRALDTYIELIARGRARAAKAQEEPVGQDGNEIVLVTMAEGIESLCSFGRRIEAEKAHAIGVKLEEWLERLLPDSDEAAEVNGHRDGDVDGISTRKGIVSSQALETVYRTIGVSQAHWALWTPFTENRDSLQRQAVISLRKAMAQPQSSDGHLATSYALGLLLAQKREINSAIEHVKGALAATVSSDHRHIRERRLIPVWHLLALLLTARQDFEIAGQTCAASFEQLSSSPVMFGTGHSNRSARALSEKAQPDSSMRGLINDMESAELQRIIEVRITELALTELAEGPEEAVNSSKELLGLYSHLFGDLGMGNETKPAPTKASLPANSSVRSFRGSIFGKKRSGVTDGSAREKTNDITAVPESVTSRPSTQTTQAPTIQVTDENEKTTTPRSHYKFRRLADHHHQPNGVTPKAHRRTGSLTRMMHRHGKDDTARSDAGSVARGEKILQPRPGTAPAPAASSPPQTENQQALVQQDSSVDAKQAQVVADRSIVFHEKAPIPPTHDDQIPIRDIRLPTNHPDRTMNSPTPRFPRGATRKHALTILAKIWLVIAALYRRAGFYDDSHEACDEAAKVAQKLESLVAEVESSARTFADAGWGGEKSSDEVWADVYCERGELALMVADASTANQSTEPDIGGVRDAVEQFEQCLMYQPDHPRGIVGLSNILLDFCEKKIDLGRRVDDGTPKPTLVRDRRLPPVRTPIRTPGLVKDDPFEMAVAAEKADDLRKTPENLNRLAARDRAYGLLATLTKLGTSWDDSEAWYALARAHELGGEVDKCKEILWWCVELEDRRPIRHWRNLGCGGYVL